MNNEVYRLILRLISDKGTILDEMRFYDWVVVLVNVGILALFMVLAVYVRRTRKVVQGQQEEIHRLSNAMVMLTANFDGLKGEVRAGFTGVGKKFEALADRDQMALMIENALIQQNQQTLFAIAGLRTGNNYNMMGGSNAAPVGGTHFEAAATVHGGIAGAGIGVVITKEGEGKKDEQTS